MKRQRFDVLTVGNAIVDVIGRVDDDFLVSEALTKGSMTLIEERRAEDLLQKLNQPLQISGGSAANTAVGIGMLGGKAAFAGKVKSDSLGRRFRKEIVESGVYYNTKANSDGPATARSMVLVSPDGERTMATYLGACREFNEADIDEDIITNSSIIYLEGYLWDPPLAKKAFRAAAEMAHKAENLVALSLSDAFCVDRFRDEFLELLRSGQVDILFANRHEITSLWQTSDFGAALYLTQELGTIAAVTKSEEGCTILSPNGRIDVPAFPVERVVDATGAGDLFASGFLTAFCRGEDLDRCGRLGAFAASEAISHFGARPQRNLQVALREIGSYS